MLSSGVRVGPYEVLARLGAGGMGEVWRARDTRLGRNVALKTLPGSFAQSAPRRARLEREARVLASLTHPHIATLYGLEDPGDGPPVLVMELVEGETLSERLRGGRIAGREALAIAAQIARALEAAHDRGILHRDLKPSNVGLTTDGQVKLLDFGLAKALAQDVAAESHLSTATSPLSDAGQVLGTAPYMSPEQARGQEVDHRSDIWAFGCVLYEVLAGQRAFGGSTVSDTVAAILEREPVWSALPEATPQSIRRLLTRCLQKDRGQRLHDIADARIEIEELLRDSDSGATSSSTQPAEFVERSRRLKYAVAAGVAVAVTLFAFILAPRLLRRSAPEVLASRPRLSVVVPRGVTVPGIEFLASSIALSPDGRSVAFVGRDNEGRRLYLRDLDALESRPIRGTEDAICPFFSPDSGSIGFGANGKLKTVAVEGGGPQILCDAPALRGASWGEDGVIVFGAAGKDLSRVSAHGGPVETITRLDPARRERSHHWPQILPGGSAALITVLYESFEAAVAVADLRTGTVRVLLENGQFARYVPTGHLLFGRNGVLMAVSFDLARLETRGSPQPVVEGVLMGGMPGLYAKGRVAFYEVAAGGTLLFVPREAQLPKRSLVWVDRHGQVSPVTAARGAFDEPPRLSPDGRRLAVTIQETGWEGKAVFILDLERDALARVAIDGRVWTHPVWMPDGESFLVFVWAKGPQLLRVSASGGAPPEVLLTQEAQGMAAAPDGSALLFQSQAQGPLDILRLPLSGERKPEPFVATPAKESFPAFSPDGRWVSYDSDESGQRQVYVRQYPGPGPTQMVSTGGGELAVWSGDGRELFFVSSGKLMSVEVRRTATALGASLPRVLFTIPEAIVAPAYDVSPDGQRFVMVQSDPRELEPIQLVVVPGWLDEMRARLAAAR